MNRLLSIIFYPKNYVKIAACALFSAASQPLIAWSLSGLSSAFLSQQLIYSVVVQNTLLLLLALVIAWVSDNIKADISYDSEFNLRRNVFSSIYSMSIGDFEKKDSGAYYNQVGRDVQMLQTNLFEAALRIIIDVLSLIIIAALLLYCHWMSLIIILLFLVPLAINNVVMPKKIGDYQDHSMETLSSMAVKLKDVLSGFFTARFQEGETYIEKTMFGHFSRSSSMQKRIAKLYNLSGLIANGSVTISQFSGLFVAFYLMKQNQIDFTQFILIFQLAMIINLPLVDLINSLISIRAFRPYIQGAEEILSKRFIISDFVLQDIKEISFTNVSYTYPEKQRTVLNDFNYRFEKGKKYLLIGESGSGKTTLVKLLLGIIKPSQGTILYDDVDQKELSEHEIYHHCAVVPQQVYIFDDTIRRNIDLRGECTDAQLQVFIQKAKLDTFFAANHYTLDTKISNETLQVSGGEKARIGLARTFTLNKSIVIYDEILSALDVQNAKLIEELIISDNDRITIHIAHKSAPEYLNKYDDVIRLNIPEK